MRFRHAIALSALALALGCKKEPEKKEAPSGEKECETYIAALDACIAKLPADQKEALQKQRDLQAEALKQAPAAGKQQMGEGCRTGLATLKQDPRCK